VRSNPGKRGEWITNPGGVAGTEGLHTTFGV
jgi:hypothetical protein